MKRRKKDREEEDVQRLEAAEDEVAVKIQEEVESKTGSSVVTEVEEEDALPDNGFPAGYGPNEGISRIKGPEKPSFRERMSRSVQKLTKKQKYAIFGITGAVALGGILVAIYMGVTGKYKIDYSGAYTAAKELRSEMQMIKSNAACEKVVDYLENAYTSMEVYRSYIQSCKEVGKGVASDLISILGRTEGVKRDAAVAAKFGAYELAMSAAKEANANAMVLLPNYEIWHQFLIYENEYENKSDWDAKKEDLEGVVKVLAESGVEKFEEFAEKWVEMKTKVVEASYAYYHFADTIVAVVESGAAEEGEGTAGGEGTVGRIEVTQTDVKKVMDAATEEFEEFRKSERPKVKEDFELDMADAGVLYARFTEMYDLIRESYQENYDYEKGGCKEMLGSVVCD